MFVIKNKLTGKYWKSHTTDVDLQNAKIYLNKKSADNIVAIYNDYKLEVLEVERIIKLK
jgi:hypothetical protein